MSDVTFRETTDIILELLNDNIGLGNIRQYFDGDPVFIPVSYLPAIAVVQTDSITASGPTGMDDFTENISIRVIMSLMDDMGKSQNTETVHKKLKAIVGERGTDNEYKPKSIMGILRTNFTLYNNIVGQDVRVQHEILSEGRVSNRKGVLTEESHINFSVKRLIAVPNRT